MPKKPDGDDTSLPHELARQIRKLFDGNPLSHDSFQDELKAVVEATTLTTHAQKQVDTWLKNDGTIKDAPLAVLDIIRTAQVKLVKTQTKVIATKTDAIAANANAQKGRRVSSDTISVLTRLDESIAAATKHLKKLPGAREPETMVSVDCILQNEECPIYCDTYYLTFHENEIQVCNEYSQNPEAEYKYIYKTLDKYDANTRVKLCAYIPDLIAAAKAAEEKVREAAEDVIASIEQAIAESMEVENE
ncbi:hypothetical protein [Novipirellula sp.]|uniref:hypothetical protein n=1 Tax=Novipirellula sp. TaxID=2795430 RepID=UPI00356541FE